LGGNSLLKHSTSTCYRRLLQQAEPLLCKRHVVQIQF